LEERREKVVEIVFWGEIKGEEGRKTDENQE
jgi:hypothetical protein